MAPAQSARPAPGASAPTRAAAGGIASRHPGDVGIASHPDVLFVEAFEGPSVTAIARRWESVKDREIMSLATDIPPASAGKQSLLMTHVGGRGTGGALYRRLKNDSGGFGHDRVFLRMYVKFDPDCAPVHHFGTSLGGFVPTTRWPQGGAGERPDGAKRFSASVEPHGKRWVWDYYCYWNEMRGSPPRGQTWGNSFVRDAELKVARGRWVCVELMVVMNDVGKRNGELAMWIDGRKVSHLREGSPRGTWTYDKFTPGSRRRGIAWDDDAGRGAPIPGDRPFEGFRWRTAEALNVNWIWAYLYVTKAPKGHASKVWFDQIVVAKSYVGPIVRRKPR